MSTTDVFEPAEAVIVGSVPGDDELAGLADELRTRYGYQADDHVAARMGVALAQVTRESRPASSPKRSPTPAGRLRRRLAPVLVAGVLLAGMTGVAMAADSAVPGDLLYPLDRALEVIGIGAGGPDERIAEAQVMFEDGRIAEAVAHAKQALEGSEDPALVDKVGDLEKEAERILANEGSDDAVIEIVGSPDERARPDEPPADRAGQGRTGQRPPSANQPSLNADERAALGSGNATEQGQSGAANRPQGPGSQGKENTAAGNASGQAAESPGAGNKPESPGSGDGQPENPGNNGQGPPDQTPGEQPESPGGGGPPDDKPGGRP